MLHSELPRLREKHWDGVFKTKDYTQVLWHQHLPDKSIQLINKYAKKDDFIIDALHRFTYPIYKKLFNSEIEHPMSFVVEAFIRLSLATGIRVTSCLTLQRKHINLETRELTCWDAKNKEFYKTFLNEKMLPDEFLRKLTVGLKPEHYLLYFNNRRLLIRKLHRFTYPIFKMLFNADIDDANEKQKVCHHTLRHSFASNAVLHNDIFLVQKLMNHRDINQTLRYAKVNEEKKAAAVAKMF